MYSNIIEYNLYLLIHEIHAVCKKLCDSTLNEIFTVFNAFFPKKVFRIRKWCIKHPH